MAILLLCLTLTSCKEATKRDNISSKLDNSTSTSSGITSEITSNKMKDFKITTITAKIANQKVDRLNTGMTYKKIIKELGETANIGLFNYFQYVIDDDKLLMIKYDDINDKCNLSGKQLVQSAVELKSNLNKPEKSTVIATVIVATDFKILVTCPTYKNFECATINVNENTKILYQDGRKASKGDVKIGKQILITHDERILSDFPASVKAEKIIIQDD